MGVDNEGLVQFQMQLEKLGSESEKNAFIDGCLQELAARELSDVIPLTPVGVYPAGSGMVGGTLRRGWTGGRDMPPDAYTKLIPIKAGPKVRSITIENPVKYAIYVEYGHRQTPGRYVPAIGKRLKASWVEGRFMLTKSENRLKKYAGSVLEARLQRYLEGLNK